MSEHQEALRSMSYGVYVVTSRSGERINGLTVAWASQISLRPPLVAVSVDRRWYSHELLSRGDHFIVHVLADDQVDLGRHFGFASGREVDKLAGVDWEPGAGGVPAIKGCKARLECRIVDRISPGDHTVFVGEVVSSRLDESKMRQIHDRSVYYG